MVTNFKISSGANPNKKVIAFDPQNFIKKAGIVDVEIFATDRNFGSILLKKDNFGNYKYGNALLILDDYRRLHPAYTIDRGFESLLIERAAMNLDIIYICHTPKAILVTLAGYTTHFSIYYTSSEIGGFAKEKIGRAHV